jgi:hypothetical protein
MTWYGTYSIYEWLKCMEKISKHIVTESAVQRARQRCRKKFMRNFPGGFYGEKYISWERDYKLNAHKEWRNVLGKTEFESLLEEEKFNEIALRAVKIETKTNLLFSFEKMALRDGVKSPQGAEYFARGLYNYVYGNSPLPESFNHFARTLASLPRKQTRVLTWPLQTVFGFIANPSKDIFLKPRVTQEAAKNYQFPFAYQSKVNWDTYASLLEFALLLFHDLKDLKPRDMIDIQSFIWVQGSEEYE